MNGKRSERAQLSRETVGILQAGGYIAPAGHHVSLAEAMTAAVAGTRTYPPGHRVPYAVTGNHFPHITVTNETTLSAAHRLWQAGHRVVALNFASAKNPGGGFLNGAIAQEEDLARSSGLYPCIVHNEMYAYHRSQHDAMYSSYAIYSPDVPVFRADDGRLLNAAWPCSFITCAAANAGALRAHHDAPVERAMEERVRKVLAIAVLHGHEAIVLGAWGCGVFRNDGTTIARLFRDALTTHFRGSFRAVIFAVLDKTEDRHFITPFESAFAGSQ